jgi:hypothetical protein
MSNHRRPARANPYRHGYLHCPAWYARRDRWFTDEKADRGVVRCAVCLGAGTNRTLELHHLDYRGVTRARNGWAAREQHGDLIAIHPRCHEWLHTLIDRDKTLSGLISRRAATARAIARLREKIATTIESGEA